MLNLLAIMWQNIIKLEIFFFIMKVDLVLYGFFVSLSVWQVVASLCKQRFSCHLNGLFVFQQRRAHSLSGCANLDSTPVLLGGTGVYHTTVVGVGTECAY